MSEEQRPKCESCQNEIDPDVCCCGDTPDNHPWNAGHSFVPMGCSCGYDTSSTSEEDA